MGRELSLGDGSIVTVSLSYKGYNIGTICLHRTYTGRVPDLYRTCTGLFHIFPGGESV
jgi:hypothetical protein